MNHWGRKPVLRFAPLVSQFQFRNYELKTVLISLSTLEGRVPPRTPICSSNLNHIRSVCGNYRKVPSPSLASLPLAQATSADTRISDNTSAGLPSVKTNKRSSLQGTVLCNCNYRQGSLTGHDFQRCKIDIRDCERVILSLGFMKNDLLSRRISCFSECTTVSKQSRGEISDTCTTDRVLSSLNTPIHCASNYTPALGCCKFNQERSEQINKELSTGLASFFGGNFLLNSETRQRLHPLSLNLTKRRNLHTSRKMAKSKFEYVKQFEQDDPCLQNCWIVVRIDGKAFHKFTDSHHYMKPNDERGLGLMTRAAQTVMGEFNEIVLAYGQSDEYSFVFNKHCKVYNRRASKIMTNVVSLFASSFTLYWPRFFNTQELQYPPSFDARVVLYPSDENLKDYLSWRQADCHINNLYNTCFWKLVQEKGLSPAQSEQRLKGTLSSDKNELLYSEFNTNYNNLPELYRKGSVIIRPKESDSESPERAVNNHHSKGRGGSKVAKKLPSLVLHTDIIGKQFWEDYPHILGAKR